MAETESTRRIRVKLSTEAAGAIALTPVVVQEVPLRDLLEHILACTGKDEARVRDLLRRGTVVSGASRFRWEGWEEDPASLRRELAAFPDPDPARPFAPASCVRAILHAAGRRLEIERTTGQVRRLFRRRSFWEALVEVAAQGAPRYIDYSYRHRADCYRLTLSAGPLARLRDAAPLLTYSGLTEQILQIPFDALDLFVER